MNRFISYLNSACTIIEEYNGEKPLAIHLKSFFSANKKYGSKDRKAISHLCYCYFRLGRIVITHETEENVSQLRHYILAGLFLTQPVPEYTKEITALLKPDWVAYQDLPILEKLTKILPQHNVAQIFPFQQLSNSIDAKQYALSFLRQPDLFIRIRPGFENLAKNVLQQNSVEVTELSANTLSLPNNTPLSNWFVMDKEIVIQDFNSQQTGNLMDMIPFAKNWKVWDCCAASGGKSLLLMDRAKDIKLTVSDIRESILVNLKKRFAVAGVPLFKLLVFNATKPLSQNTSYDCIICDVPCTGSGTWSRTPEALVFFDEKTVKQFQQLQLSIANNVLNALKPGGYLLYITCSVFKMENEEVIEQLQQKGLRIIKQQVLKGYHQKADTMFAALLQK